MQPDEVIATACSVLPGIVPKVSWGETALFYNPSTQLPNGVYFATIKDHDGANDQASDLNRPGVYRLSIGLSSSAYERLFGPKPKRPPKGQVVDLAYDFRALRQLMPHPIYAWMCWAQVLAPDRMLFETILPHIHDAHAAAVAKFNQRIAARGRTTKSTDTR